MGLPCKPPAETTRERRMRVFKLKMQGLSHSAIASELSVNRKTIIRDADWLSEHLREAAVSAETFQEVGLGMARLQGIEEEAMLNAMKTISAREKNAFLQTALSACRERLKLMLDSGVIARAPVNLSLSVEAIRSMSTPELLQRREECLHRLKEIGMDMGAIPPAPAQIGVRLSSPTCAAGDEPPKG
jgi:hypothetical protein